jgi:hypothetical protein
MAAPIAKHVVLSSIALLVLIRFFTEVVPVVPRAANFIDVPLFMVLSAAGLTAAASTARSRRWYLPVAVPVMLFLGLCAVSVTANLSRVELGPVLVFLYGFLAPLGVYAAVYRLWPVGKAISLSRLLVALGVVQLFVVFTIDLRRFISSGHNPDVISGTFGTNAYQLVFFLLVVTALLATMLTCEPGRLASRLAPALFFLILVAIFLAQYRALLVTTAVTVIVIGALLRQHARGVIAGVLIIASLIVTLQYISAHFPHLKFASTVSTLFRNPGFYVSERLNTFRIAGQLYTDSPSYILTGTGPGTFSSRAWQTFAQAQSKSQSNVQGQYVSRLTGDSAYHTDVSDKYVLSRVQNGAVIQGSGSLSSPFSSYLSLMAETGLFGFFLMGGLYVAVTRHVLRLARHSLRSPVPGDPLPALLVASAVTFTVLLQMGLLAGNWLEVTRVTFLSWTLLAIATKELEARSAGRP